MPFSDAAERHVARVPSGPVAVVGRFMSEFRASLDSL